MTYGQYVHGVGGIVSLSISMGTHQPQERVPVSR